MLRIKFSDRTFIDVKRGLLLARDSCFQHAADDDSTEVIFEATDGRNRDVLHEYFGCGRARAQVVTDRQALLQDLEAWAIPENAYPVDLRLSIRAKRTADAHEKSLEYQVQWVGRAVEEVITVVEAATDLPIDVRIGPGDGHFEVQPRVIRSHEDIVASVLAKVHGGQAAAAPCPDGPISERAYESLVTQLEDRLHLPILGWSNSNYIRIGLSEQVGLKRRATPAEEDVREAKRR